MPTCSAPSALAKFLFPLTLAVACSAGCSSSASGAGADAGTAGGDKPSTADLGMNDVSVLFVITEDGSLLSTRPALEKIQEWYNDTYMLISLITATPLTPVEFDFTGPEDNAASANRQKLTNVFAMVYLGLLHFAQTFGVDISERLRQCTA